MAKWQLSKKAFRKGTPKWVKSLQYLSNMYGGGGSLYLLNGNGTDVNFFGRVWTPAEQFYVHLTVWALLVFVTSFFYEDEDSVSAITGPDLGDTGLQTPEAGSEDGKN